MRRISYQFICIFLLTFVFHRAYAQEKLVLTVDRDIYIGGETVWFTLAAYDYSSSQLSDLSKVVYFELINKSNVPIVQSKIYLNESNAQSKIVLPDTISTGNYLLRAYTHWMKNFGESCFEKKYISVINPFAKDALPKASEIIAQLATDENSSAIDILLPNEIYGRRQEVNLSIENKGDQVLQNVSVSVVKSCLLGLENRSLPIQKYNKPNKKLLIPEFGGELLRGTITNIETGEVIADEKVMLSFISSHPILKFSKTDSLGRFVFEINRFGEEEMVIQPYSNDTSKLNYKVTLDDAFSNEFGIQAMPELILDSIQVKRINEAIINMQINTVYSAHTPQLAMADSLERRDAFYGKPEIVTLIDKYIQLPNVEEVIREIVPFVSLRKKDGQYIFKVYEDSSLYPRDGETMTFVDGIPMKETRHIFDISPEDLERIEVVNLNYYLEDEELGRVLCFYTREGNMAEMDFDSRIFRQAHQGYLNGFQYGGPDYSIEEQKQARLVDYRNVLYFNGCNDVKAHSRLGIDFFTSDEPTDYTIVVSGANFNGEIVTTRKHFQVK